MTRTEGDYERFKEIINCYGLYDKSIGKFCRENGWDQKTYLRWKKNGVPKNAWSLIDKDLQILGMKNLMLFNEPTNQDNMQWNKAV